MLDDALIRLAELDKRKSRIAELLFLGGLSLEEMTHGLDISMATAERDWRAARAWLYATLKAREAETTALGELHTVPAHEITEERRVMGTIAYMSPEQAEGHEVDHRSDIFSLGVLLYKPASGQRPFAGESTVSLIASILKDTPPSVTALRQELPRELGRLIRRCLAKDRSRRYQSALDLRNELEEIREDLKTGGPQRLAVLACFDSPGTELGAARHGPAASGHHCRTRLSRRADIGRAARSTETAHDAGTTDGSSSSADGCGTDDRHLPGWPMGRVLRRQQRSESKRLVPAVGARARGQDRLGWRRVVAVLLA
jgi:serine/threonine protein kinase